MSPEGPSVVCLLFEVWPESDLSASTSRLARLFFFLVPPGLGLGLGDGLEDSGVG